MFKKLLSLLALFAFAPDLLAQSGSSVGRIVKMDINADVPTMNIYMDDQSASNGCSLQGPFAKTFTTDKPGRDFNGAGMKNINAALIAAKAAGKRIEVWYSGCLNNAQGIITTIKLIE